MKTIDVETHRAVIWIAGDYDDARRTVRKFCMDRGFCATVTKTTFIYTGGEEVGVSVGCLNYPRFPCSEFELDIKVSDLAVLLMNDLSQHSVLICSDNRTRWISRRENQ